MSLGSLGPQSKANRATKRATTGATTGAANSGPGGVPSGPVPTVIGRRDDWLVVNKPAGWLTHAQRGVDAPDVVQFVREQHGREWNPVHRLDRGTSGVLVLASGAQAAHRFNQARAQGMVQRAYLAIVRGRPATQLIDHPVPNDEGGPRVPAQTWVHALESVGRFSLVLAHPVTGRFHQIRRHCKHVSCPLVGDSNYGKGDINRAFAAEHGLRRLALHSLAVRVLPEAGFELSCVEPMWPDMENALRSAGFVSHYLRADYLKATALSAAFPSLT